MVTSFGRRSLALPILAVVGSTGLFFSFAAKADITQVNSTPDGIWLPDTNIPLFSDQSLGLHINGGLSLDGYGAGTHDINFGSRAYNSHKSPAWWEASVVPALSAEWDIPNGGELFGGLSGSYSMTRGNSDGDPEGDTPDHPEHARLDRAYLGWRSGDLLNDSLGHNALSFSFGRQAFRFGDGFLVGDGFTDEGKYGAFYIGPSVAFQSSAVATLNTGNWHVDLFHLKDHQYEPHFRHTQRVPDDNTSANGMNLDYTLGQRAQFGAAYMHVYNSNVGDRNGMNVYNLRAKGRPFDTLPGLSLAGQYVYEHNGKSDHHVSSTGWFGQATYTFDAPWSPSVSYRYAQYGKNYDPLFYSFAGGWGTWYFGEIAGEYMFFNTNMKVNMLKFSVQPTQSLDAGVIAYNFDYKSPSAAGARKGNFASELDLYTDWSITQHLSLSGVYGIASPGKGAQQAYSGGHRSTSQLVELFATYTF